MNALFVLIFTCGGALAIGRGLDLALWTDWNTGLCTAGKIVTFVTKLLNSKYTIALHVIFVNSCRSQSDGNTVTNL